LCFSSDEFPTASSSEADDPVPSQPTLHYPPATFHELRRRQSPWGNGMRRCMSNEKLVSFNSHPGEMGILTTGRQRRRSVNFSAHDQHVDYSPRDTVEALHHTLASRRKKARRRETRRRNFSGDACAQTAAGVSGRRSDNKRSGSGRTTPHFSGNNSSETDLSRKGSGEVQLQPHGAADNAGDRPTESTDPSVQTELEIPPTDSNVTNNISNGSTDATNTTITTNCPTDPSSSPTKRTTSAVTLCANPLFELDEE
uniref:Pecanex-like protein n=1 Tax=Echinostoma caproni TaxID=27848 RepID=A0A183AT40_9TREM